jgi:hypothetical protein
MKSTQHHLYGLIIALFIISMSFFLYRHFILDVPLTDSEQVNSWVVEANLHFIADHNQPVKANFIIPYRPTHFTILDEYFVAQHYGVSTALMGYNRHAIWSLRRSGSQAQSLYYRAIFRENNHDDLSLAPPSRIKSYPLDDAQKTAINTIIQQARQSSADIQTFAQVAITELNKPNGNAKLLVGQEFTPLQLTKAAILVLNNAKISAMQVQGLQLKQQNKAEFKYLLAVYTGKEWFYLNPKTGEIGLPNDFLVWQLGDEPMFHVSGGKKPSFTLTVSPTPMNALSVAKAHGLQTNSQLLRFSLLQLPVHVQETYKILLTLPVGAFIILLLRNFIGLKTFGTFMPVLIALAFRETHVVWGVVLFTLIVSAGLLVRFYLDQLRLLLVPRLSAILTVVILLMVLISILCNNLGLESGLSVALFPMVILTMTIERMCITWDERGAYDAIKSGVGSLIAATLAYWAMSYPPLQYIIFAFPELLLAQLSLILWLGQYRGYRFFELFRFNALA